MTESKVTSNADTISTKSAASVSDSNTQEAPDYDESVTTIQDNNGNESVSLVESSQSHTKFQSATSESEVQAKDNQLQMASSLSVSSSSAASASVSAVASTRLVSFAQSAEETASTAAAATNVTNTNTTSTTEEVTVSESTVTNDKPGNETVVLDAISESYRTNVGPVKHLNRECKSQPDESLDKNVLTTTTRSSTNGRLQSPSISNNSGNAIVTVLDQSISGPVSASDCTEPASIISDNRISENVDQDVQNPPSDTTVTNNSVGPSTSITISGNLLQDGPGSKSSTMSDRQYESTFSDMIQNDNHCQSRSPSLTVENGANHNHSENLNIQPKINFKIQDDNHNQGASESSKIGAAIDNNPSDSLIFAFVNPKSGGNMGAKCARVLAENLGAASVCDLSQELPQVFIQREVAQYKKARILVCGGDGTVSWILNVCAKLRHEKKLTFQPPLSIIPLGTGNDLARSLGWGPCCSSELEIPSRLKMIRQAEITILDQWDIVIIPKSPLGKEHKLRSVGSHPQLVTNEKMKEAIKKRLKDIEYNGEDDAVIYGDPEYASQQKKTDDWQKRLKRRLYAFLDSEDSCEIYHGSFQNYFSLGIDARVTCSVEDVRNTQCGKCSFKCGVGKLWYPLLASVKGGSLKCCNRSIAHEIDMYYCHKLRSTDKMDEIDLRKRYIQSSYVPGKLRTLCFLNINSYCSGSTPYKHDLGKQRPHDGLLEVLGARNFYTLSCNAMFNSGLEALCKGKAFVLDVHDSQYMQSDGEGWCMDVPCLLMVQKSRTAVMLRAPKSSPYWSSNCKPSFWPVVVRKEADNSISNSTNSNSNFNFDNLKLNLSSQSLISSESKKLQSESKDGGHKPIPNKLASNKDK